MEIVTFANCPKFISTFEVRSVVKAVVGFVNCTVLEVTLPRFTTWARFEVSVRTVVLDIEVIYPFESTVIDATFIWVALEFPPYVPSEAPVNDSISDALPVYLDASTFPETESTFRPVSTTVRFEPTSRFDETTKFPSDNRPASKITTLDVVLPRFTTCSRLDVSVRILVFDIEVIYPFESTVIVATFIWVAFELPP